jgi:hypothetical protein
MFVFPAGDVISVDDRVKMRMILKRVCLVSPGHIASSPRLVKEADAVKGGGTCDKGGGGRCDAQNEASRWNDSGADTLTRGQGRTWPSPSPPCAIHYLPQC